MCRHGHSFHRSHRTAKKIIVPNFRANNVSIVDLAKALRGDADAEVARIPLIRADDGRPARPKGSAVTSDGRYAVISAGPRVTTVPFKPSGYVYVIDLKTRAVVGTVTGVGNDLMDSQWSMSTTTSGNRWGRRADS